jgi:protocatechuate 3,4-dioxygenase, beta subunit
MADAWFGSSLGAVLAAATMAAGSDGGVPAPRVARSDLYQCEGCEGVRERDAGTLSWSTRIGPGIDRGEPLRLEGTVVAVDGRTPVPGVVIYAYQTNAEGLYANGTPGTEASRRHGRLRGWAKTGPDGRYRFETIKPAPYPRSDIPAHVHLTVLEPGRPPYWIDDVVFAGEFGVTEAYRRARINQGGDGIVALTRAADGTWLARRDIRLEPHPR